MSGAREHDLLLFEELMQRHVDLVHHVARAWTRDVLEAEDLTQTAFIKAWQGFAGFRAGTHFKAWILAILRHAWVDRLRARGARPPAGSLDMLGAAAEPEQSVEPPRAIDLESKDIFYDVFGGEVARLLRGLPDEFRLAVLLCDCEGLSYQEIAAALDVPVGTVRSRIHRGRALLQERLRDYAGKLGYLKEVRR